jgi:hypothetical protein
VLILMLCSLQRCNNEVCRAHDNARHRQPIALRRPPA